MTPVTADRTGVPETTEAAPPTGPVLAGALAVAQADASVALEAPRINALQKFWLREIGIEKTWLQAAVPVLSPQARAGQADTDASTHQDRAQDAARAAGGVTARQAGAIQAPVDSGASGSDTALGAKNAATPERPAIAAAEADTAPSGGASGHADTARPAGPAPRERPATRPPGPPPRPAPAAPAVRAETPATEPVIPAADFDGLREQVQQCTACGLCQGRRHAVFGMGARPARWMVVGEAPGEQEDRQGLPFVGRSGQLLDAMLNSVGMSRETDVFIANVIKCRPPGNRNPKPEEIAACSPYLKRQIELIRPERILVLGRFAAQTLLGTDATIGSLRGRSHTWTGDDGLSIPVIVSYHPAYLLRSPVEKARAWQDLQLAVMSG